MEVTMPTIVDPHEHIELQRQYILGIRGDHLHFFWKDTGKPGHEATADELAKHWVASGGAVWFGSQYQMRETDAP